MVHGISRSIRYIIKLKQPIDRFDTFLPLCSEVRYNLNLVSYNTKIEVFGERELDKRFSKVENVYEYFKKMDIDNFKKMDIDNEDMNYTNKEEVLKYKNTFLYSTKIKFHPIVYSKEDYQQFKDRLEELKNIEDKTDDDYIEQYELFKKIDLCNIVYNPEYFEIIKETERKLTNIELTAEEKVLIYKIKSSLLLYRMVESSGFELTESHY